MLCPIALDDAWKTPDAASTGAMTWPAPARALTSSPALKLVGVEARLEAVVIAAHNLAAAASSGGEDLEVGGADVERWRPATVGVEQLAAALEPRPLAAGARA